MSAFTGEKKLRRIVRDILKNCPSENAGQFLADRISLAYGIGYAAGKDSR